MGKKCTCGRSLTDNCVGWGDLSHSEWQTRKLIVEAQISAKEVHEEIIRLIYPDGSF
jgi:3-deoxy-D-arabino-heptulosonate 7-phosphate (DAHP) synthase